MYPLKAWNNYNLTLKASGERKVVDVSSNRFLVDAGLINENGSLTSQGVAYFQARFIKHDDLEADSIIRQGLLTIRPVLAICQHLFGVRLANKDVAESLLRFHDLAEGLTSRSLGTLLTIMSKFEVIQYSRGEIIINEALTQAEVIPDSIFISRKTPFSNQAWLRRVLKNADGFIYWFDKHFLPSALERIWEVADGNQIDKVRILSLELESNSGKKARSQFSDLRKELAERGIQLEWRFIDSTLVRDTHDRWIIGKSEAWNVPDVGTILSGSHSEISKSDHHEALNELFTTHWEKAAPAFE